MIRIHYNTGIAEEHIETLFSRSTRQTDIKTHVTILYIDRLHENKTKWNDLFHLNLLTLFRIFIELTNLSMDCD